MQLLEKITISNIIFLVVTLFDKIYYTYIKIKQNTAVNNNIIIQIILNHEPMEMET